MGLLQKIFGTHSENELKRIYPIVDEIEALGPQMEQLSDEELKNKTQEFKSRLKDTETLDDILPEAFAVVREAAGRTLGMKHYRVQLIGGIILHQGRISEMKTGEGKTLVSTLPAYLNALTGEGVHIVTVNDYLAKRDAEWMGQVHEFLGLTVGVVLNSMDNDERRAAYNCDITYVTNNELGFDYLRDNMVIYKEQLVQRGLKYAIIDEVDSVLIDEARTPLIISGQSDKSTKLYEACDILARQLEKGEASGEFSKMNAIMGEDIEETGDFIVNEKEKNINLNVALKLGKQIKKNCPDVKVIYTRDRDIFIPLDRRAEIANNAKADLFISIHTNALAKNRTAKGASTWTLGLAKSDANLEVAKRENAVILYESDYKTRYAGFNPNSAESYIIFEFMQDKYMSQSVHLASLVQKHFRQTCKRTDRGVHQAGFLVLKASAMPSILVELGFISTPEEERYLNTEAGTTSLANGIFRAFLTYKREQEIRLNGSSNTILPEDVPEPVQEEGNAATATPEKNNAPQAESNQAAQRPQRSENAAVSQTEQSGIVFKIQILTSSRPLAKNDKRLKGVKDVDYYKEGGIYKYTYGASPDYNKVLRSKRSITDKFKDAFIIAFKNGEKINVNTAISEFKKNRNK